MIKKIFTHIQYLFLYLLITCGVAILFCMIITGLSGCVTSNINETITIKEGIKEKIQCDSTIVSVYWAVPNQTDNTPTITASGFKIKNVNNPPRICAVPRNLIGVKYEFGDSLFIDTNNQYLKGWWRVEDVMNSRYSYCDRVDLLVKPNYMNLIKVKNE